MVQIMRDIETKEDVTFLINEFYLKAKNDPLLFPIFIHVDFEKHLPKMIHFWNFILFDEPGYTTNVSDVHKDMRLKKEHYEKWLTIFELTFKNYFEGEKTNSAIERAKLIGFTMQSKFE